MMSTRPKFDDESHRHHRVQEMRAEACKQFAPQEFSDRLAFFFFRLLNMVICPFSLDDINFRRIGALLWRVLVTRDILRRSHCCRTKRSFVSEQMVVARLRSGASVPNVWHRSDADGRQRRDCLKVGHASIRCTEKQHCKWHY